MAKSYITKFAEYTKTCKNNLKNTLKTKGISVLENDTLDTLINKVADVTAPPVPTAITYGYTRDANLPDLDALFDADPLREANGGEYRSCAYLVCLMYPYSDTENQQNITVYGSTTCPCKIVFGKSDRELSVTSTSSYNFIVNEDEIYTLTDGRKVYILKIYTNYSKSNATYAYHMAISSITNLYYIESICDNTQKASLNSTSNYSCSNASYSRYERYVAPIHDNMYFTYLINAQCRGKIRIDGNFKTNLIQLYFFDTDVEINGDYIGDETVIHVGTDNQYTNDPIATRWGNTARRKLIIPSVSQQAANYGNMRLNIHCYSSSTSYLYKGIILSPDSILEIPDCYKSVSVSGASSSVNSGYGHYYCYTLPCATLHLPNTINTMYKAYSSPYTNGYDITFWCSNVRNLTLSPNAYGLNETALTLEAPYYMPLLTLESLANLITNLADRTGKTANTIKFNKFQKTLLTEEQLTTLQNKNWTVTFAL